MSSNLVILATLAAIDENVEKPIADARTLVEGLDNEGVSDPVKCRIVNSLDHWPTINRWWHFLADHLPTLELLAERGDFEENQRAALLASKILHCLNDQENALRFALTAGDLFSLKSKPCPAEILQQDDMFVQKMIERAIDDYAAAQKAAKKADEQLVKLIDRIIVKEMANKCYSQVIDLSLLIRRLDYVTAALKESNDPGLLGSTIDRVLSTVLERTLCDETLDQLVKLMEVSPAPSYERWIKALVRLDRPHDGHEAACQLAIDLYHSADQQFVSTVLKSLDTSKAQTDTEDKPSDVAEGEKMDTTAETPAELAQSEESVTAEDESDSVTALVRILKGQESTQHFSQFLIKSNKTDILLLKQCKDSVRSSITHNGTVLANGLMHAGTTCDDFLRLVSPLANRDNLDWVSKATNWNKFNAVASLGLIHKGHEADFKKLLEQYLPQAENVDTFGYKEGGALYALGLIYANHGSSAVIKYLREHTQANSPTGAALSVNIRHGACLGLGLAAMGTHDIDLYNALNECLHMDDAVTGEAAAIAIGLIMAGSLNEHVFQEMISYAVETTHDKIKRGLAVGIALLMYGRREQAEPFFIRMQEHDSEVSLRQTAVLSVAMAYAGTGNAPIVGRLLSRVANDPNDDVKRFAATSIGLVMLNHPAQCLEYASMLTEHFNGCIRYGAAMAVAISNAGSGNKEAIALVEPMLSAKESFVRQGAVIAMSMLMIQHNEVSCPKVKDLREKMTKMITEKGEESIVKFGAIIAQGILDGGGRNVTIDLCSRGGVSTGNTADMCAVAGTLCFLQYWFWHSMVPMISLAFRPTCLIALNADLKMPKVQFQCNAPASKFAYPPPMEEKKDKTAEKLETVQLSMAKKGRGAPAATTTTKKDSNAQATSSSSSVGPAATSTPVAGSDSKEPKDPPAEATPMEVDDTKGDKDKPKEKEKTPEPSTHVLDNPARVLPAQLRHIQMGPGSRYSPVKPLNIGGMIVMKDGKPDEQQDIVVDTPAGGMATRPATQEVTVPPKSFTFNVADYRPQPQQ